jgi:hypothetical protein
MGYQQSDTVTDMTRGVYRRLYSGFIKGHRINKISLAAEAWFWRILATVDDFGNADADPGLCFAATVGRRKGITTKLVAGWLGEMEKSGLIRVYPGESGDKYLHVIGFTRIQPAGRSGRRVRRVPSPGESRGIQGNPGAEGAHHYHNHYHNQDHYQDQDQDHNQDHLDLGSLNVNEGGPGEKKEKSDTSKSKYGTRLSADFVVSEDIRKWAAAKTPDVNLERALGQFIDYWLSMPGTRGLRLDWDRTFRNWLRISQDRAEKGRGYGSNAPVQRSGAGSAGSDYVYKPKSVV